MELGTVDPGRRSETRFGLGCFLLDFLPFLLRARDALTNICGLSYATKFGEGGSMIEGASRPVGIARRCPVAVASRAGNVMRGMNFDGRPTSYHPENSRAP